MNLSINFKLTYFLFILFSFLSKVLASEVPRPRGVSLSRAPLYPPDKDFTCLDGSQTIPFSRVNDDYCDCYDASDEPGTAACLHGLFHCTNAGHKPQNIPSNRVNDEVCDCCDGTDEYANDKNCLNNCIELGRNAREAAQRRAELIKAGKQLRAELIQKGMQLKQEKEAKLKDLQKDKEEAERLKEEKEVVKKDAEGVESIALDYYRKLEEEAKKKKVEEEAEKNRAEAIETFKKFDSNQDGVLDMSELQTRQSFDKDRNGEVSEEEAKYFLNEQESVDEDTFINNCWTNIKPYLMMDANMFRPLATESEDGASEASDLQEDESENDEEAQDEETEEEEEDQEVEPPTLPEEEEAEEESKTGSVEYDEETQNVIERANIARNEFQEAEKQVQNIEAEIKTIQEYLEVDFGTEEEFSTLQGECFEFRDNEYIYKLCPFDKTSQQSISGSSETRLGSWGKWSGPEPNKYDQMTYERGQSCWNGPQRSSIVRVSCGGENKVISVSEPNRCEYFFDFITPAACKEAPGEAHEDWHDEL